ncbi:hypothetical protein G3M48_005718 [Beauveria asiatica]|uniref:Peptidase A1 domain-containing protein n=1 Tax=Beauveria asiatica TaxID=1069075 RepID=A0AAW0RRW6_9HYPO
MHFSALVALTTATSALASPVQQQSGIATLQLKQVIRAKSASEVAEHTKARIASFGAGGSKATVPKSGEAENAVVSYVANVTVGSGTYQLIVDTGSSNTWVGADKAYKPGPNSKDTGHSVQVGYGSGGFDGEEYLDTVSIAGLSVPGQGVGVASDSWGFRNGIDGIFGVGPVALTQNTVEDEATVPTFLNNLFKKKLIPQEVFSVYFHPEAGSDSDDINGELTFGGVDNTKFTGPISYVPTQKSGGAAPFWGVSASFQYGSKKLGSTNAGIVDTGTTLIALPDAAYKAFLAASGGSYDSKTQFVRYSKKPSSTLSITFGSTTYTLTPDQYLVPKDQYANLEGFDSSYYYAWIGDGGNGIGEFGIPVPDTIIGQKFLEHYYSVYDTTNSRVGFAKAV